jgi:ABC-type multidrug transport system fused ATPase/permease subunit
MHPLIQKILEVNLFSKKHKTVGHYFLKLIKLLLLADYVAIIFYGSSLLFLDDVFDYKYNLVIALLALFILSKLETKVVETINQNLFILQYEKYRQMKKSFEEKTNREKLLLAINHQELLRNEALSTDSQLTEYYIQCELYHYQNEYNELLLLELSQLEEKVENLKKEKGM